MLELNSSSADESDYEYSTPNRRH